MMKLKGYKEIFVRQQNNITGCIPASIEWMMRYKNISVSDDFQKKFDLEYQGIEKNNYETVRNAILKDKEYANINFEFIKEFESGKKKFEYIEEKISNQNPVCMAYLEPLIGNFHSVPIVEIDERSIFVLTLNHYSVEQQKRRFPRKGLILAYKNNKGGKDTLAILD